MVQHLGINLYLIISHNSIDTRIALMQGLIDSDGNVESNGYNFYTASYDLAKMFNLLFNRGWCKNNRETYQIPI